MSHQFGVKWELRTGIFAVVNYRDNPVGANMKKLIIFIILIGYSSTNELKAQEKLQVNYTTMVNSFTHNIDTHLSETKAVSIIASDKLFQQLVFAELRYEDLHFYDQFNNEYSTGYLSLGIGPRFSLFNYFTYDIGFYLGFRKNADKKWIRDDFPERSVTEGKIMSIQRLGYELKIFSDMNLNIYGEIHHHFNNLVQDFTWGESGQAGYKVTYDLGIGLTYQFRN